MKKCLIYFALLILIFYDLGCSSGSRSLKDQPVDFIPLSLQEIKNTETADPLDLINQAEYYYGFRKFKVALEIAQKIIIDFENTLYSDEAYFIKGNIYASILNYDRDMKKASAAYRMVIDSLPESEFDKEAELELQKIKKKLNEI